MKILRLLAVAVIASALCGCGSMLPNKRTENTGIKSAESVATQQTLSVEKIIEADRPPGAPAGPTNAPPAVQVTSSGSSNAVSVKIEAPQSEEVHATAPASGPAYKSVLRVNSGASQRGGASEDVSSAFKVSLPVGVSWALAAVGIVAIVFAIKYAKNASPAVAAGINAAEGAAASAISTADTFFKNRIQALREKAMLSTDPTQIAQHTAEIASLEAQRGQLAASAATSKAS